MVLKMVMRPPRSNEFEKHEKKYVNNENYVYHYDDNWSLGLLDINDHGSESNRDFE